MKQININLDDEIIEEVSSIAENTGINLESVIQICLKKIYNEQSISFLFSNNIKNKNDYTLNSTTNQNSNEDKMTKSRAIRLFLMNKNRVCGKVTFASKNKVAQNYWANPPFEILKDDWSLILNDWNKKKIYLFHIPANTINQIDLVARADNHDVIDLQIMYNDITFTDNRSGYSFNKFLIETIEY